MHRVVLAIWPCILGRETLEDGRRVPVEADYETLRAVIVMSIDLIYVELHINQHHRRSTRHQENPPPSSLVGSPQTLSASPFTAARLHLRPRLLQPAGRMTRSLSSRPLTAGEACPKGSRETTTDPLYDLLSREAFSALTPPAHLCHFIPARSAQISPPAPEVASFFLRQFPILNWRELNRVSVREDIRLPGCGGYQAAVGT